MTKTCNPQLRVLIAEDNPVSQMFALRLIEKQGHIAHVVANGQLAVDAMLNEDFDVVLMDINMPIKNGLEAVQLLREWEQVLGTHVPVIAATANASAPDREKCLAAGMDDFVSKPFKAEELAAAFDRVLQGSTIEFPVFPASDQSELSLLPRSACDIPAARKRLNGDDGFLKQLAQLFLETVPEQMKSLNTAVQNGNGPLTVDLAHSIKGSVKYFFSASAYDAAQRLEFVGTAGNRAIMEQTYEELVIEIGNLRKDLLNGFPSLH